MKSTRNRNLTAIKEELLFPIHRTVNYFRHLTARRDSTVEEDVIVSLTTHPARFDTCIHSIMSILRQTRRPFSIELYVSRKEIAMHPLPQPLTDMTDVGLHIVTVAQDSGSYSKLIHSLERWPDKTIVTADDDKLYPPDWLAGLIERHRQMPGVIVCRRARLMTGRSDTWQPYVDWADCRSTTASAAVFPLGVGGVLYPPGCFHPEVVDIATARAVAPTSDDIWFKLMAWRNRTLHCQVGTRPMRYDSIPNSASSSLHEKNLWLGGNDAALANVADRFGFVPSSVLDQ